MDKKGTQPDSLSQEEAAKQAEELAKEIKKLKAQLNKTTPKAERKKRTPKTEKLEKKKTKTEEKAEKKKKTQTKTEEKLPKAERKKRTPKTEKLEKKKTKTEEKAEKKKKTQTKTEEKTYEEELEEQLTDEEIENFQIEKVDMDRLTNKVCEILAQQESGGMLQSDLWKKLKLSSRDGSRLALKLERMGVISREKILEKGRWTYKLIIEKTPVSTQSIEGAPCLTCPVEQKCSIDGEVSPRTCQWIEDWVIAQIAQSKKKKK